MNIAGHDIGVCSWSLRPADMADLLAQMHELELSHVQLGLAPLLAMDDPSRQRELELLGTAAVQVTATMISFDGEDYASIAIIRDTGGFVPDAQWPARRQTALAAGKLTAALGVKLLSTHIGFIPPSNQAGYSELVGRVRELATALGEMGVELLMETGQEEAGELLKFINDVAMRNVRVNFDPANMILYGAGDPIEAVQTLGRHIRHVHVKDATLSTQPGVRWGQEVPFGTGQVNVKAFLAALHNVGYRGPLVIEREAGDDRMGDVRRAIQTLRAAGG